MDEPAGYHKDSCVPSHVAALVLDARELADVEARGGLRAVGHRCEVSLGVVEQLLGEDRADALWAYQRRCGRFWDKVADQTAGGERYVRVNRMLLDAVQDAKSGKKTDLGAQYDALVEVAGVGELIEEATSETPDWERVTKLGETMGLELDDSGDGAVTLRLAVEADSFDPALGGAPSRGELRRWLTVVVRHAVWRDRRRRRLARVTVEAEEVWPEPAGGGSVRDRRPTGG
jgi:hypothetical protein